MNLEDLEKIAVPISPEKAEETPILPPEEQHVDPTESFDATRKARQEALKCVELALAQGEEGKLNKKEIQKALRSLKEYVEYSEMVVVNMMRDFYQIIQSAANSEMAIMGLQMNLRTMVKALDMKGIANEEELKAIHREVLDKELPEGLKEQVDKLSDSAG